MKHMLWAEPDEDPGLCGESTGNTGWTIVCGTAEGGVLLDYDGRNAAMEYSTDGCGTELKWLGIDYEPGLDLVLLWTHAVVYGDDMEHHVEEATVLVEGFGAGKTNEDLLDSDWSDEIPWSYLGLDHSNCSHAVKEPATETKPGSVWETRWAGWRCVTCGLATRRQMACEWLAELIEQRAKAAT